MDDKFLREERILKYLKGQMPEDERSVFEKECEDDPALKEEVEYIRDISAAVYNKAALQEQSMRELLLETEHEIHEKKKKVVKLDFGPIREQPRVAAITGEEEKVDPGKWLEEDSKKKAASKGSGFGKYDLIIIIVIAVLLAIFLIFS